MSIATRLNGVMIRRSLVAISFVLGACGTADAVDSDDTTPPTAIPTVPGVGTLPDTIPMALLGESDAETEEPIVSVVVTRPVDEDGIVAESVAERVNGNRLLVIGDSILASTASRYGGELCDALNPIGWSVEVDAEPGRFVRFGNEVAEARLDVGDDEDDFDAVVIHMGSNYGRDRDEYYEELSELLYRAAPRPTLLLTVTEYRPQWSEVNEVIAELADLYDNVTIVDWEKIARTPGVLSRDGLHPGEQGEAVLVEQIAVALGELGDEEGECLRSSFTDDSAINEGSASSGGSGSGGTSSGGSSSGSSSSGGSSSGGSSSGGSSSGSSSGGSSSGGSSSGGTTTGGTTTGTGGTDSTGGTTTGGADTGGTDTGGTDATGGTDTGGVDSTGGTDTGGTDSGGTDSTGGTTSGTTGTGTTGGTDSGTTTGGTSGGTTSGGTDSTGGSGSGGGTTSGTTGTSGGATGGATSGSSTSGTSGGSSSGTTDSGGGAATGGTDSGDAGG